MTTAIPLFSAQVANKNLDFLIPVKRVLDSHWYILGKEVSEFEREFAGYCGVPHCVGVANGTDALELALRALGIKAGERVVITANAGFYGNTALRLVGAVAQYVDINPKTLTMQVEQVREALKSKPRAVLVTHLYGQLAEIEDIVEATAKAGVPVIEDCAQAHGAKRQGKHAGSFGAVGCFSFYPTKNLGALGDGGALITRDEGLASQLKQLRQYGWGAKYQVDVTGGRNSRLDELQASILREKLPHLDGWNIRRREIAHRYNEAFSGLAVECPASLGEDFVAHLYVLRLKNRNRFRDFLKTQGVATDVHYPIPDHLQPVCKNDSQGQTLPATVEACESVVSLPCFPGLTDGEVEKVIQVVNRYFKEAVH